MSDSRTSPNGDERPPNLLDYFRIVWKYSWLIVAIALAATGAAYLYTKSLPRIFVAKATIIAPRDGPAGGIMSGLNLSGMAQSIPGLSVPDMTPHRDLFVSLLKARTIAEKVSAEFKLRERYKVDDAQDAVAILQAWTDVSISKEGVIAIVVQETDPKISADIANAYVRHLDDMLLTFTVTDAGRQRQFIEKRLLQTRKDLELSEEELCLFQEAHRAVALQDQTRWAVEAAAEVKGQIVASEIQLEVLRNSATEENPEVVKVKSRIEELKRQLSMMQYGKGMTLPPENSDGAGSRDEIYVSVSDYPELSLELARLNREKLIQEKLYAILVEQLEQTKISEARDAPQVRGLDVALPPLRPSKPILRLNLILAGIAGLLLGIFIAFFSEYLRKLARASIPAPAPSRSVPAMVENRPMVSEKLVKGRRLRR